MTYVDDEFSSLQLIVVHESGLARIVVLQPDATGSWTVHTTTKNPVKTSVPHPIASFVIDSDGDLLVPTPSNMPSSAVEISPTPSAKSRHSTEPNNTPTFWLVASAKEIRCFANLAGERLARAEWSIPVRRVEFVARAGGKSSQSLEVSSLTL